MQRQSLAPKIERSKRARLFSLVFRFLLDYQWVDVDRLNAAGAQIGQDAEIVSLRSQFAF